MRKVRVEVEHTRKGQKEIQEKGEKERRNRNAERVKLWNVISDRL